MEKRKIIIISTILVLIITIVVILLLWISPKNQITLNVNSHPEKALVYIEGKEYKTPFSIKLSKGKEYEFTFYKTGYFQQKIKKIFERDNDTLMVTLKSELTNEEETSKESKERALKKYKEEPITKLKSQWFSRVWAPDYSYVIEYISSTDKFYITIANPDCKTCKEKALAWFKKQKVDPNKLQIVWLYQNNIPDIPPQEGETGE